MELKDRHAGPCENLSTGTEAGAAQVEGQPWHRPTFVSESWGGAVLKHEFPNHS